jgi:hypothetical protein
VFTALFALVGYNTKLQLLLAIVISVIHLLLQAIFQPFIHDEDDFITSVSLVSILLTLLVAHTLRVEIHLGHKATSTTILFTALAMPLFAVVYVFGGKLTAHLHCRRRWGLVAQFSRGANRRAVHPELASTDDESPVAAPVGTTDGPDLDDQPVTTDRSDGFGDHRAAA